MPVKKKKSRPPSALSFKVLGLARSARKAAMANKKKNKSISLVDLAAAGVVASGSSVPVTNSGSIPIPSTPRSASAVSSGSLGGPPVGSLVGSQAGSVLSSKDFPPLLTQSTISPFVVASTPCGTLFSSELTPAPIVQSPLPPLVEASNQRGTLEQSKGRKQTLESPRRRSKSRPGRSTDKKIGKKAASRYVPVTHDTDEAPEGSKNDDSTSNTLQETKDLEEGEITEGVIEKPGLSVGSIEQPSEVVQDGVGGFPELPPVSTTPADDDGDDQSTVTIIKISPQRLGGELSPVKIVTDVDAAGCDQIEDQALAMRSAKSSRNSHVDVCFTNNSPGAAESELRFRLIHFWEAISTTKGVEDQALAMRSAKSSRNSHVDVCFTNNSPGAAESELRFRLIHFWEAISTTKGVEDQALAMRSAKSSRNSHVDVCFTNISPGAAESELRFRLIHFWEAISTTKGGLLIG
ncbi:hypothetical protein Bca101_068423 [Brassica carinata]